MAEDPPDDLERIRRDMQRAVYDVLLSCKKVPAAEHAARILGGALGAVDAKVRTVDASTVVVTFTVPRWVFDELTTRQRRGFVPEIGAIWPYNEHSGSRSLAANSAWRDRPLGRDRGDLFREGSRSLAGSCMVADALAGCKRVRDVGRRALYESRVRAPFGFSTAMGASRFARDHVSLGPIVDEDLTIRRTEEE